MRTPFLALGGLVAAAAAAGPAWAGDSLRRMRAGWVDAAVPFSN